jgi:hypothetical protein
MTTSRLTALSAKLPRLAASVVALIIILMPFHAFLTVWLSDIFGHYTVLRLWKELLLALLAGYATYLLAVDTKLRKAFLASRLNQVILVYAALTLVVGFSAFALDAVTAKAFGYGLIINLRFLVFFLAVWVIVKKAPAYFMAWPKWLAWPFALVVLFGLLQYFVLPYDFLRNFGYNEQTIFPYATINHNLDDLRVFSTLRGANPLGAYLLLALSVLAVLWRKRLKSRRGVLLAAGALVLFLSFSRSAWIGTVLSAAVIVWCSVRSEKLKKASLLAAACGILALTGIGFLLRDNTTLQNLVFHTNEQSTVKVSSNDGHATALKDGLKDISASPLGDGVGSAGPASVYNGNKTEISENYFIQIGQETGWLGMALLLAINALLALELWRRRQDPLALGLFAALVGLTFVNLLSHAWADDTLAYIFWGLAAIALASKATKQVQ